MSPASLQTDARAEGRFPYSEQLCRVLLGSVDAGLAAMIILVPLLLGGRIAWGQLVLVALALWIAICWCLRQCLVSQATWVRSGATLLLTAALTLAGLQLVALPPWLLETVSPQLRETLPLWTQNADSSATLGIWTTSSLTPTATRDAFILLLAFGLLLLTTLQRVRKVEDVERLLRWIAVSTLAIAVFALTQSLASNGKYFWFFKYPFVDTGGDIKGSFTNGNHFAQFIALGIGPLIWWVFGRRPSKTPNSKTPKRSAARHEFKLNTESFDVKQGLRAVGLACCVFVGLMSLSRGGALVIFLAALVCTSILYRASLVSRKTLLILVGTGLFAGACLSIHGYDSLAVQLTDFFSPEDLDREGVRRNLWQADLVGVAEYPLTGTGLGSHREVFPMYLFHPRTWRSIEFTHAENGYLQAALEAGIPGLLLVLSAVGLCIYWCFSTLRQAETSRVFFCMAAIAASLAASFVQSMWDFVWYVPGCMVVPVVLAACACRLCQLTRHDQTQPNPLPHVSRFVWLAAGACLLLVGCFMVQDRIAAVRAEPSWHRFLLLNDEAPGGNDAGRRDTLHSMVRELSTVVKWQPGDARAHARLAAVHFELFNQQDLSFSPLSIEEIRHDVLESYNPNLENAFRSSADAMRWLSIAMPKRYRHLSMALRHARRALALCPLQGEGYLPLVAFSFLEGPQLESTKRAAFLNQAILVRPFDGDVLYTAGTVAVDKARAFKEAEEALINARSRAEIDDNQFANAAGELSSKWKNCEAELQQSQSKAIAYWQASFKCGPVCQMRLLEHLVDRISIGEFQNVFQPDMEAQQRIVHYYRTLQRPDELRIVQMHLAKTAEDRAGSLQGEPAAEVWRVAAHAYGQADKPLRFVECLLNALRADPTDYKVCLALGKQLFELKRFDEAEEYLKQYLEQDPDNPNARKLLEASIGERFRLSSRPRAERPSGSRHNYRS